MDYLTLVPTHELLPRGKRADSPLDLHRAVMSLFDELPGTPRHGAGILFRRELIPGMPPSLLVRSSVAPTNITEHTRVREIINPSPGAATPVAFRIAVNGIHRVGSGGVRPVAFDDTDAEGDEPTMTPWLQGRLQGALSDVTCLNHTREVLGATRPGRGRNGTDRVIQIDTVDGVATVAGPARLVELMRTGVGRAKSYGCGLLTVKRLA